LFTFRVSFSTKRVLDSGVGLLFRGDLLLLRGDLERDLEADPERERDLEEDRERERLDLEAERERDLDMERDLPLVLLSSFLTSAVLVSASTFGELMTAQY